MKQELLFAVFLTAALFTTTATALTFEMVEPAQEMVAEQEPGEEKEQKQAALSAVAEDFSWSLEYGLLTISGYGDMPDYNREYRPDGYYITAPWYSSRTDDITTVVIKNGITSIGNYAFYGSQLKRITIPDSVTSIGGRAFENCTSLTSITIPDGVTSIGNYAFDGCTSLASIIIPDSVTSIGGGAFSGCTSLTSITLPDSVTSIGGRAFENCTSLTSITIPDSVISIGESAFYGCNKLSFVYISYLDAWCKIDFADSYATPLHYGAALHVNGVQPTEIIIPDGITTIDYAFYNLKSLKSITIPNSVTSIGKEAFRSCISLTSITIPDSVTSIGNYAFHNTPWYKAQPDGLIYINKVLYDYKGLMPGNTKIDIIPGTVSISGCIFVGYTGLTSVTIPDSVTSISEYTFYGCTGLTSITIPNSVTSIDDYAFYNCSNLGAVYYSGLPSQWEAIDIGSSNDSLKNAARHYTNCGQNLIWSLNKSSGVLTISGTGAMYSYNSASDLPWYSEQSNIKVVVLENGVTSISDYAFYECTGLASITIPDGVTSIGNYAFYRCTGLTSVAIGNCVTSIGNSAFDGCTGLTSITIPDSVTSIGNCAFYGCTGLTSITIPDSVTSIDAAAFYGCTGLTSITIPDSVISIGHSAFEGCTGLTSITIPGSVTSIRKEAFRGCTGLTSITILDSVTSIGNYAFSGCTNLKDVFYAGSPADWRNIVKWLNWDDQVLNNVTVHYTQCGKELTWSLDKATQTLTISGNGAMYDFDNSAQLPWHDDREDIAKVILEEGVTRIGDYCFADCTNLANIVIPSTVTSIGEKAFENCTSLAFVDIVDLAAWCAIDFERKDSNPLVKDGVVLYLNGKKAVNLTVPDGVECISDYAFYGYDSLKSIVLPDSVTSIGIGAFKECGGLSEITLSNNLTEICQDAFYECDSLAKVVLPDSLTMIGEDAFCGCSKLESLTIGKGLKTVYEGAFSSCSSLKSVYITDLAAWCEIDFYRDDDSYYSRGSNNPLSRRDVLLYVNGKPVTDVVIPQGVTKINDYAFYGYGNMTSVTIPASVTEIGTDAFSGTSYSYWDASKFQYWDASKFQAVYISDLTAWSKIKFAASADNPVTSAHNLYLNGVLFEQLPVPEGLSTLSSPYTFSGASCITSVAIPKSLTTIGQNVFLNCDNVTDIYYAGTADEWERVRIGANNGSLSTATVHYDCVLDTVKVAYRTSDDSTVTGMPSGASTHGDYTIPQEVPKRPGYTFLGWSTTPDGEVEYEPGSVYTDNTYVTLYAVWEKAPYLLGDIDGNDTVDLDDAILLFQHSMLPELYPISYAGNVDFNKDGTVDIDDAVLLFQYSMLPDLYPIE